MWLDDRMTDTVLVLATVTVGLTAGVMFCYQIAIMPGLHELGDRDFIRAYQRLDQKIVNPLFVGVSFLGGGALLVVATALQEAGTSRFTLLGVATVVYVGAVLLLTMAFHVPRNNELARVPVNHASDDDLAGSRAVRRTVEPSAHRAHARLHRVARAGRGRAPRQHTVTVPPTGVRAGSRRRPR